MPTTVVDRSGMDLQSIGLIWRTLITNIKEKRLNVSLSVTGRSYACSAHVRGRLQANSSFAAELGLTDVRREVR